NHGYDDARGDYVLTLNDHVAYRYEVTGLLGKGSFGQVVKCWDHKDGREVAVKIIRNKRRFEKQGLVECRVLDALKREDVGNSANIIHMLEHFHFRGHLCITFELLGLNLYEWLKAGGFKGVGIHVIRRFSEQILQCLDMLGRKRIVHCDLKPERVGNSWYAIKVIDFGSSCFEDEKVYTYVQSRFYRSPEVILGISYNMAIDMWSLGCILAELYTGYPLFPGENEQEQLACIMEIKGVPDKDLLEKGSRRKLFFDSTGAPRVFTNSKGKKRRPSTKTLPGVLRCTDTVFIDFIERCLDWDPAKRMTPAQALQHEFITGASASVPAPVPPVRTVALQGSSSSSSSAQQAAPQPPPRAPGYPAPRPNQPGRALEEGRAVPTYSQVYAASQAYAPQQQQPPGAPPQNRTPAQAPTPRAGNLSVQPAGTTNIAPSYPATYAGTAAAGSPASYRQPSSSSGASPARTQRPPASSGSASGSARKPPQPQQPQPWR
ncbi:kinase-like domain-containing protein, partial [Hyaloraphidium curvatum]